MTTIADRIQAADDAFDGVAHPKYSDLVVALQFIRFVASEDADPLEKIATILGQVKCSLAYLEEDVPTVGAASMLRVPK